MRVESICIVGGGSAGWMCANYLNLVVNKNGKDNYDNLVKIKSINIISAFVDHFKKNFKINLF